MPKIFAADVRQGLGIQVESVRDVCAYFLGYDTLTPEKRKDVETSWGYKSKCIRLLAQLCGVSKWSVKDWGRGLEFSTIPPIRLAQLTIMNYLALRIRYVQGFCRFNEEICFHPPV